MWLGEEDSNPCTVVQSHVSYHWTIPQKGGPDYHRRGEASNADGPISLPRLEVRSEPDEEEHEERRQDDQIEPAPDAVDRLPVLPEHDADVRERERPEERAEKGVGEEPRERHACGAGGEGDERAHDREEARPERDLGAVFLEPPVGPVVFADPDDPPSGEPLRERPSSLAPQPVPDPGSDHVPDRARERDAPQRESPRRDQVSREGHDDLARQGDARALDRHAEDDARIAPARDDREDEGRERSEDRFEHAGGESIASPPRAGQAESRRCVLRPFVAPW